MDENEKDNWMFSDVLNDCILDCEAKAGTLQPGSQEHVVIVQELISLCDAKSKSIESDLKADKEVFEREIKIRELELKERELNIREDELYFEKQKNKTDNIYRWVDRGGKALGTGAFLAYAVCVLKTEAEDNRFMKTSAWRLISSGISKGIIRPPM